MKPIKIIFIVTILLNLVACNTVEFWQRKSFYEENFKDFLVTKEGDQIVILGTKYHYIFKDSSNLVSQLLAWNSRSKLRLKINNFKIQESEKISGWVTVNNEDKDGLAIPLNKNEKEFLKKLGFKEGKNFILSQNILLKGERYLPKKGVNYNISSASHFNKEYKIDIEEPSDLTDKAKKIALTPILITADGVAIVTGTAMAIVVIPLVIPVLIVVCIKDPGGACS